MEEGLRKLIRQGRAGKTLDNYRDGLTTFCRWCVERDFLSDDPLKRLRSFDITPRSVRRALTLDEVQRLLAVAPAERRLVYEIALATGLRVNELKSLRVELLDLEEGGLQLEAAWTKNRKGGFQPLPRWLVEKLGKGAEGKANKEPLLAVASHPARELDKDLERAGIPKENRAGKVDFHSLRVAYTTLVIESGANVKEAQTLARHSRKRSAS